MKGKALRIFAGLQAGGKATSKWASFGRSAGQLYDHIPLPIIRPIINRVVSVASGNGDGSSSPATSMASTNYQQDFVGRRMLQFEGHIAHLSFDVPEPVKPKGLMDKSSALAVKYNKSKTKKVETKKDVKQDMLAGGEWANVGSGILQQTHCCNWPEPEIVK